MLDKSLPHLHPGSPPEEAEGPSTTWQRSVLLVTAITLHNIPEGLVVGVAFGVVVAGVPSTSVQAAMILALGIGLQNAPEGIAVAMPLRGEGVSRLKSFWYGQLSAIVEPVAAVLGAAAVIIAAPLLPYALSFAAGAMIYVVVEELIPESQRAKNVDLATVSSVLDSRSPLTSTPLPKSFAASSHAFRGRVPCERFGEEGSAGSSRSCAIVRRP